MHTLKIITASTREGRKGPLVADWFTKEAKKHGKFNIETIDLAEVELPLFDEPKHPRLQEYEHDHTKAWSERVKSADAFVFVTPEYNHTAPPSLLNALVYLNKEWAYKPVGFVSYGGVSAGTRGVDSLLSELVTLKMVPLPEAVNIPFFARNINEDGDNFQPGDVQSKAAVTMLDELLRWTDALQTLRR